jgi:hypothetical protein
MDGETCIRHTNEPSPVLTRVPEVVFFCIGEASRSHSRVTIPERQGLLLHGKFSQAGFPKGDHMVRSDADSRPEPATSRCQAEGRDFVRAGTPSSKVGNLTQRPHTDYVFDFRLT